MSNSYMQLLVSKVKMRNLVPNSLRGDNLVVSAVILVLLLSQAYSMEDVSHVTKNKCEIFKELTANDLSINDIVVKNPEGNLACIKARFSLAIKVEASSRTPPDTSMLNSAEDERFVLGYLPLDTVVKVEDSCPELKMRNSSDKASDESDELDMIVTFECGKLSFKFKRDQVIFLDQIKGYVRLDANTKKDFLSKKPMLYTSETGRHFKYNDLIEVNSEENASAFILTAHFYSMEYEAFRKTMSRDFLKPPDEDSKPLPSE